MQVKGRVRGPSFNRRGGEEYPPRGVKTIRLGGRKYPWRWCEYSPIVRFIKNDQFCKNKFNSSRGNVSLYFQNTIK